MVGFLSQKSGVPFPASWSPIRLQVAINALFCTLSPGFSVGVAKVGATLGVFVRPILKSEQGIPIVLGAMVKMLGFLVTAILAHGVPEGGAGLSKIFSRYRREES